MQSISDPKLGEILLELNPEMEKMIREVEGYDFIEGLFRYVYGSSDMDPNEIRRIASQLEEGGKIVTALQQDTMRIRQELKLSKQMVKEAQQVAERNRLEAEAAKSKAIAAEQAEQAAKSKAIAAEQAAERKAIAAEQAAERKAIAAEQAAERKAIAAEQAAERKLTATVMNLLQEGLRIETISKCVGLPLEAIQKLAQQFGQGQTGLT